MITGYISKNGGISGYINHSQTIVGQISVPYGEYKFNSDHEVVTIDRYRLNEQVIAPTSANAMYSMESNEITTNLLSPVNYSLTSAEIQTETYTITPIEVNFEEDIEL